MCPRGLSHNRDSPQKVGSKMGPLTPEYPRKPEYSEYAEQRRINEIANHNLATNQKVGSSSLSGRAIPRLQASTDVLRLRPAKSDQWASLHRTHRRFDATNWSAH